MWQPDPEVLRVLEEYATFTNLIRRVDMTTLRNLAQLQKEMWRILPKARKMVKILLGEDGWKEIRLLDLPRRVWATSTVYPVFRNGTPLTSRNVTIFYVTSLGYQVMRGRRLQLPSEEIAQEMVDFLERAWHFYDDDLFYETAEWDTIYSRCIEDTSGRRIHCFYAVPGYCWKIQKFALGVVMLLMRLFKGSQDDMQRLVLDFINF